jgi:pimeloyl-ACP methyl ester carboxylesterase
VIKTADPSAPIVRRSVRVDGRRLSYLIAEAPGADETVLLIHGSGMSARCWVEQLRGLGNTLRVVALDLPGHGQSEPVPDSSVEAHADAAAGFLAALRASTVFVAGHSLGGAVAVALAARRPPAVGGLVLLSSCARLPAASTWTRAAFSYLPGPVRKVLFFAMARRMLFAPGASDLAVDLAMREIGACRADTILKDLDAADAMDVREHARGLDVPTLIMCGSRDAVTPPILSEGLHSLIRASRLSIVEGMGHMLFLEAPDRVNRDIRDFLGSLSGPRQVGWARPALTAPGRSLLRRVLERVRRPLFGWA